MAKCDNISNGQAKGACEITEAIKDQEARMREISDRIGELQKQGPCDSGSLFDKTWCRLKGAAEDFGRVLTGGSKTLTPAQKKVIESAS